MEDKTFINWKRDELNDIFGLQKAQKCTLLETWLDNSTMITLENYEKQTLSFLRTMAVDMVGLWKEADLRDSFISPIVSLAGMLSPKDNVNTFSEVPMEVAIKGTVLKGKAERVVAMGLNDPKTPFFFIHEYKPIEKETTDGLGQLLAAMLAARVLNQQPTDKFKPFSWYIPVPNMPLYGCYIIDKYWQFVTLVDLDYCVSESYIATKEDDLLQILRILKQQKEMIFKEVRAQHRKRPKRTL